MSNSKIKTFNEFLYEGYKMGEIMTEEEISQYQEMARQYGFEDSEKEEAIFVLNSVSDGQIDFSGSYEFKLEQLDAFIKEYSDKPYLTSYVKLVLKASYTNNWNDFIKYVSNSKELLAEYLSGGLRPLKSRWRH